MVAIPLYCKSLGFQFETKLCIFQNISKYFFEKIPHLLPNMQRNENQTDITKMLNVGDDPAEWDFGRVPPPTPHLRPHFRNLRLSGAGHANETARFSKHNRWRSKEMQSVRTARAAARNPLFADGGRNATAVRRGGAAANCATLTSRRRNACFMKDSPSCHRT